MKKKKVLFISTNNSARSQIAEGLLNHFWGDSYLVFSAGTNPTKVNPNAITVMGEIGIDISHHRSKPIDEFKGAVFDIVVTVCDHARETCPFFPGARKIIHRSFQDPSQIKGNTERIEEEFRKIRDQIKEWITKEVITAKKNRNNIQIEKIEP